MFPYYRSVMGSGPRRLLAGLAVLALAGCVGATPRDEFDAEVRARGGGLTMAFVDDSLAALATEVGAGSWTELEVMFLTITPGSRSVTASVRDPRRADFVDTIVVSDGKVVASTPVRDADELPLDDVTVRLGSVALDRVEEMSSAARAAFGESDGYVSRLTVTRVLGAAQIDVALESARVTATATFDANGDLVGIER